MNEALLEEALKAVQKQWADVRPLGGMILGSGWNEVVDAFDVLDECPYDRLPGLGRTGVKGHAGRLVRARVQGGEVLIFQGRRHWYEGDGWTPVALPIYLLKQLGAGTVLLTNAAGGISEELNAGDFMLIRDHINGMGTNPLIGPHRSVFGERFPDMSSVYDAELRSQMRAAAGDLGAPLVEGVYLATTGPSYETPAEIHAFRAWGADAVGMSTVPEALLARASGLRVAGLSCITNLAAGVAEQSLHHDEVVEIAGRVMPRMRSLLSGAWERIMPTLGTKGGSS